jgi:hypothetical protein
MAITAEYLPTSATHRNPSDFTPELSRRARGVEIWAALRHLGRRGVADMIERCCRHARRFAEGFNSSGYRVLNNVVLNQVLVSFGNPEKTQKVIADANCTKTCLYLSFVLLLASAGYAATGIGGLDSLGAVAIFVFAFREGREAFGKARVKNCSCHD